MINIHRYKPNICRTVSVAEDFLGNIFLFIFQQKEIFFNTVGPICVCIDFCSVHPNSNKNRMLLQIIVGIKIAIVQFIYFFYYYFLQFRENFKLMNTLVIDFKATPVLIYRL